MLYQKNYFSALMTNLSVRSERAAQGLLGLGNPHLRQFLHEKLTATPGTPGAWLADPVFESTFGWKESDETMASLQGEIVNILLKIKNSFLPTKQILIGL